MIERFAPKTAALDTPKVDGEAIVLLNVVCIISPESESPAPTAMAANTLGIRIFHIILSWAGVPLPNSAFNPCANVILETPTNIHTSDIKSTDNVRMQIIVRDFLFLFKISVFIFIFTIKIKPLHLSSDKCNSLHDRFFLN